MFFSSIFLRWFRPVSKLNDRLEDENARQQFRWRKDYEINIRILDELKKSSFLYQEAALDAYWATLQGDLKSPSILHWQTEAYNSMRLSLENVKSRFSEDSEQIDLSIEIENFEKAYGEIFSEWMNVHDAKQKNPAAALPSTEIAAQLRSGVLDRFEALRGNYLEARRRIIHSIETNI